MASIFKRRKLKDIPKGAEIIQRKKRGQQARPHARWYDHRGKECDAPLNDAGDKIIVEARTWTVSYVDYAGKRRTVSGFRDKRLAEREAAVREGETDAWRRDPTHARRVHSESLALVEHVEAYEEHLEAKGSTAKHVQGTVNYIQEVCQICGFETVGHMDGGKVSAYIAELRRGGKGVRVINARITAVKSFTRWLFLTDRIRSDPMKSLSRDTAGEKIDRRHRRRALADDEVARLIRAAEVGPVVLGITGTDRAMLYRLAVGTGFRANELRSLFPESFHLADDPPTVTVEAGYSKNRQRADQPIDRELADGLTRFLADKPPQKQLFEVPAKPSHMIRADLERAGIVYRDESGNVADFHALRHTFITRLIRSGAPPKVVQVLARHSTITLTLDRYTHLSTGDLQGALAGLPRISAEPVVVQATGTEGRTKAQRAAFSTGQNMSSPVNNENGEAKNETPVSPSNIGVTGRVEQDYSNAPGRT